MSEQNLEMCPQPQASRTPSYPSTSLVSLRLSDLHLDLVHRLKRRNLRHHGQLKNVATRKAVNLFFRYNARSISELYDQCEPSEWADLVYTADVNLHKHLNIALELFIKDSLSLQRSDRWLWFIKHAEYNCDEVIELHKLFAAQNIDVTDFSNAVYSLLRCTDPKINCLRLIGTPNSGKTLIAQMIASSFISAYVNNHNSENEFYLSGFLNKAICICEELMITPATAEDFKSILGGAKIDISKKYTSKQILIRTPIIVTSNHQNFGRGHLNPADEQALSLRCHTFIFKTPYRPKFQISLPSLAYLIYVSCTSPNKNDFV